VLLLLVACGSDRVAWAVNHASVSHDGDTLTGTHTWEFFREGWTPESGEEDFVCARAQRLAGNVASEPTCADCRHVYTLALEELETDCSGEFADSQAYSSLAAFAFGDVDASFADDDPHPSRSLGWYLSVDGEKVEPFGWAWDEALDYDGEVGGPGWSEGTTFTLWPAVAWEL
jgi:hypothetical protein